MQYVPHNNVCKCPHKAHFMLWLYQETRLKMWPQKTESQRTGQEKKKKEERIVQGQPITNLEADMIEFRWKIWLRNKVEMNNSGQQTIELQ